MLTALVSEVHMPPGIYKLSVVLSSILDYDCVLGRPGVKNRWGWRPVSVDPVEREKERIEHRRICRIRYMKRRRREILRDLRNSKL
jgi:hypothetical protein